MISKKHEIKVSRTEPTIEAKTEVKPGAPVKNYPRIMYHPEFPDGRVIHTPQQEAGLCEGWVESPTLFEKG